jgi:hypothetical protein
MKYALALAAMTATLAAGAAPAQAATHDHIKMMTLTASDNGRHIRVPVGEHVMVQLTVRPRRDADPTTWWRPIDEHGRALAARPVGTAVVRGMTAGHYLAVRRGEATLSSTRPACPANPDGPTCHAVQGWSVTIDVR